MQKFHSHGKLLISGEYVVLDGATALALPTKFGQDLEVKKMGTPIVRWQSLDHKEELWFKDEFAIADLGTQEVPLMHQNDEVSKRLFLILSSAAEMAPNVFKNSNGFEITTKADFPRVWGLGTSSTLVANLSKWLEIDPYKLLERTFGGSGYDVAVAMNGAAITFEKHAMENSILKTSFDLPFKDQLFFVHLNQKQNSRKSIEHYRQQDKKTLDTAIEKISALTHSLISCRDLLEFELLLELHENVISQLLGLQKVKSRLFPDYPGAVKSLGGWGGDFVLATGKEDNMKYFREKGYSTILSFEEMILQ
ncbi:GYDIA family GHMP kinase [Salinimicrobium sediminilitoris]|uniref:GYDIA family GHMP kinase n=1 Tax=Salinimicrobium sediminilitoris TaxID=2876715 RepID=UPI001E2A5945|nr:GYDIA family GHMP kinase [Salinimicrobium sediminilitoris]MCC8360898.1 GHMP kinase [Salinimicrobium sediminilitoris]